MSLIKKLHGVQQQLIELNLVTLGLSVIKWKYFYGK
jgi:hypothetical protein